MKVRLTTRFAGAGWGWRDLLRTVVQLLEECRFEVTRDTVTAAINEWMGVLDERLSRQLNAVHSHSEFRRLEAAWRSLDYLVQSVDHGNREYRVVLRVLNCGKRELHDDLRYADDYDQSEFWKKVYSEEFDTPGGHPFGLLIGDMEFQPDVADTELLGMISRVAAASFAPFIAGGTPRLLGSASEFPLVDSEGLDFQLSESLKNIKWRSLRQSDEARFLGLVVPRILLRDRYRGDTLRRDRFRFSEGADDPSHHGWLWGNGAFALAEVVVRSYQETGWLATIRGVLPGETTRGLVLGPNGVAHAAGRRRDWTWGEFPEVGSWHETDRPGVAPRCSTDVLITEQHERAVAQLGLIPLCVARDTPWLAIYSTPSLQKPLEYDSLEATINSQMSAMLQYILCLSLFARYVAQKLRRQVGASTEPGELEMQLNEWLSKYVTVPNASLVDRAKYPLQEARVKIDRDVRDAGKYCCVIHLRPHFELDDLTAAVRLETEFRT